MSDACVEEITKDGGRRRGKEAGRRGTGKEGGGRRGKNVHF